jgi:hypothetical protein
MWTGSALLVWGGAQVTPQHGESYDPTTNSWSALPTAPLTGRSNPISVWTGRAVIVWGGQRMEPYRLLDDGASYTP